MTLPIQERDSLLWTEDFLKALLDPKKTPRVPAKVRRWASSCLHHYPTRTTIDRFYKRYLPTKETP